MKLENNNENRLFVIILLTVGVFSAFMSNTGTIAVLLPVVVSMALNINAISIRK
ncbi:MAG TPA: SLC13 family permease [Virgibacillus sp.]|nr:SLC13 family permease [Virgibacillus sp.]